MPKEAIKRRPKPKVRRAATVRTSAATRERIVTAAIALFAKQGFNGTTTKQIARQARVNEALIFRHFPTKKLLYTAIIQRKIADRSAAEFMLSIQSETAGKPVECLYYRVAANLYDCVRTDPNFLRLLYFSALEGHALAEMFYAAFTRRLIQLLAAQIEHDVGEERFRPIDAETAARAFLGMNMHYILVRELFDPSLRDASEEQMIRTSVGLFLEGIRAPQK